MIAFLEELMRRLLWLPEQASTFAQNVDRLHYVMFIVTMVAAAVTGGVSLVLMFKYRERSKNVTTPIVHPSGKFEFVAISVPTVVFLAWFYIGFKDYLWMTTPPANATDVYVTGKKWMWHFAHPDGPNENAVLHVPANRPVRLLMTSRDVIHSFFVPDFRVKQDVVPGRYTELWFEATKVGRFPVRCTEFCGTWHSQMLAEVVVMAPADYDAWLAKQRQGGHSDRIDSSSSTGSSTEFRNDLVSYGKRVAEAHGCFKCHSTDGEQHIGPTWTDLYMRKTLLLTGETITAEEGYLTESMMDPYAKVVKGYQQVMPSYRGKLTAPEAAALVEFIKSLRTNRLDNLESKEPVYGPVQPSTIN